MSDPGSANGLVWWLTEQIDQDGRLAAAGDGDPSRMIREVGSKRALLAEHGIQHPGTAYQYCRVCHDHERHDAMAAPCRTVRIMALAYADRPGYRAEWGLT